MGESREMPIRVAVIDDHEVVRIGIKGLFDQQPDFEWVGEAATAAEAERLMRARPVDVLLLDIRLPDGSGVEICRNWKTVQPDTRIIMLTSFGNDELLFASLQAGAAGYLLKSARGRTLLDAIRTVSEGGSILDPAVADKVLKRATQPAAARDPLDELTQQERRILTLVADGLTNREIGERVFLSEKTVKHYVSNILSKLGLARRAEAAAYLGRRQGLAGDDTQDPH